MRQTSRIQCSFLSSADFLGTCVFSCVFDILCMPLQRYIDHTKHKKSGKLNKIKTFSKLLPYIDIYRAFATSVFLLVNRNQFTKRSTLLDLCKIFKNTKFLWKVLTLFSCDLREIEFFGWSNCATGVITIPLWKLLNYVQIALESWCS